MSNLFGMTRRQAVAAMGAVALGALATPAFAKDSKDAAKSQATSDKAASAKGAAGSSSAASATGDAELSSTAGTVTFDVDMSGYPQGSVVRLWLPVPVSDEYQQVSEVTYSAGGDVEGQVNTDDLGNQMLYVEWGADTKPADRTATLSFHAMRDEIRVASEDMVESGEPGTKEDPYLQGSSMVKISDASVQEQAAQITQGLDSYLDKARAVYDWVYDNMVRDESVQGCGQGDICELLSTLAGKCTDINSTFVGLCRASGIPAKEVFGIRMNADDITANQHCWASFFLPGTGWIPVDPADVLKAVLKNEWSKDDAEALDKKEYFWGGWDSQRVQLSAGRDLMLVPAQDDIPLNDFGYPYAEVDGAPVDFYDPETFAYTASFKADE